MDWQSIEKREAPLTAYLAARGFEKQLQAELESVIECRNRLFLCEGTAQSPVWAANTWRNAQIMTIASIAKGSKHLRSIQRNWKCYPTSHFRRCQLIEEQLPKIQEKRIPFPSILPRQPMGSWTLLTQDTMLLSPSCSSPYPNGDMEFVEDKNNPPNRAYLKLWEIFTRLQVMPAKGQRVMELGASPGGWSWVLNRCGVSLLAVDRAPLADPLMKSKNIEFVEGDAWRQTPEEVGSIDWLFSDLICYPEKLFGFVKTWLDSGKCKNFICTLKFQGDDQYDWIAKFKEIPGSHVLHLHHNKHEATWYLLKETPADHIFTQLDDA